MDGQVAVGLETSRATTAKILVDRVRRVFPATSSRSVDVIALDDVSIEVRDHEIVGLLGPSGCGKTTLLNLIAGFDRPTDGAILVAGRAVERPGPDRMVVFQFPALFAWLTVWENVVFGPKQRGERRSEYEPRARALVQAVGLAGREHDFPYQLSGGMKQRVQLARALLNRPQVLLMDEPFGALDSQTRSQMQELLLDVWARYHPTILLVTHDPEEALLLCHRIYVMGRRGTVREELAVPFPYPRAFDLIGTAEFARLKVALLAALRAEERPAPGDPPAAGHPVDHAKEVHDA
ncbi:MAG: ABC transporter ATP-binding protein [Armatimonadota bacterium]|nr:ABC transporter ATP-binding protein [Armatimonadota bacterium]